MPHRSGTVGARSEAKADRDLFEQLTVSQHLEGLTQAAVAHRLRLRCHRLDGRPSRYRRHGRRRGEREGEQHALLQQALGALPN